MTIRTDGRMHLARQRQKPTPIPDRVDRVEAEAVEAKLLYPVKRVVHEEIAHLGCRDADRRPPGRMRPAVEEGRSIGAEVISVRPEMVVHDVEEDHQPEAMRRVDQ